MVQLYQHNRYYIHYFRFYNFFIVLFELSCKFHHFCNSLGKIAILICVLVLQAYAAEAGAERAEEPMEEAGMSDEIIQKAGITYCTYLSLFKHIGVYSY